MSNPRLPSFKVRNFEATLKRKVMTFLKKTYPEAWFYKAADKFTSGIPDILGCLRGAFFAIELKAYPNETTLIQDYVIRKIKESGGKAFVCYNVKEVESAMIEVENSGKEVTHDA